MAKFAWSTTHWTTTCGSGRWCGARTVYPLLWSASASVALVTTILASGISTKRWVLGGGFLFTVAVGIAHRRQRGIIMVKELPELTKRQIEAIASGRLTLKKLYEQKGWEKPKWL